MPFVVAVLVLQRAASDFKQSHGHSRPNLSELDTLIASTHKDMVSYFDAVLDILEGHNPAAHLLVGRGRLSRWEEVLHNLHHSLAKWGIEVLEYQVRIGLADCAFARIREIVSKKNVVQ